MVWYWPKTDTKSNETEQSLDRPTYLWLLISLQKGVGRIDIWDTIYQIYIKMGHNHKQIID